MYTPEGTPNLVQTLSGVINENDEYWIRVRLPMLPNGRTGWVPRRAIGPYNEIWTHLVIDPTKTGLDAIAAAGTGKHEPDSWDQARAAFKASRNIEL